MVLVNRLPGARTTISACSIASITGTGAAACAGSISTRRTARPPSRTVDSPRVTDPSSWWTTSVRGSVAAGYTRPLIRRKPGLLDPLAEASGDVGERRDDDVSDRVVAEFDTALEPVVEDVGQPLAFSECDEAVAHVSRRRDPELVAQPAARPAIVRDGDDRSNEVAARLPQATEEHRQARAATEPH
jgi:hypothetical protein